MKNNKKGQDMYINRRTTERITDKQMQQKIKKAQKNRSDFSG